MILWAQSEILSSWFIAHIWFGLFNTVELHFRLKRWAAFLCIWRTMEVVVFLAGYLNRKSLKRWILERFGGCLPFTLYVFLCRVIRVVSVAKGITGTYVSHYCGLTWDVRVHFVGNFQSGLPGVIYVLPVHTVPVEAYGILSVLVARKWHFL